MGFLTCAWTGFLRFTRPVYARPPRSPADDSARPRATGGNLGPVAAHAEPERNQDDAKDDRVHADQPHERDESHSRAGDNDDAEGHRQQTVQDEQPLALDLLAQPDRGGYAEDAGDDGPHADQH